MLLVKKKEKRDTTCPHKKQTRKKLANKQTASSLNAFMGRHARNVSFSGIDEVESSGILSDVVRKNQVFLGGSSVGKGLTKAARYFLKERVSKAPVPEHFELAGASELNDDALLTPVEDSFYVVDIGVLVSQVYQWRQAFPRVEAFYAVKCNPDPVIVRTLAVLGVNFDCASRNEIRLVQEQSADLPRKPDIIFANPCKARAHILEAVCKGVKRMTFDNIAEVQKIASISKNIELVLRIATDDRGSLCRLSSKFGAPRSMWKPLLACAKENGIQVVGVSFHVGSGCRDASRYELALKDARKIFDMAKAEFGFDMKLLDIGGGFPGETHGLWNPQVIEEDPDVVAVVDPKEGYNSDEDDKASNVFMFFNEIAEQVAPIIDQVFPIEEGVRIIGEPGRYFVAACATLCCSVISVRTNGVGDDFEPEAIDDNETAQALNDMTREEEDELVRGQSVRMEKSLLKMSESGDGDTAIASVMDSLGDYAALFARRQLVQQEADVYNDSIDFFHQDLDTAMDMLGPPTEDQQETMRHTVEGMNYPLVASNENEESGVFITLATAGEAAVSGVVMQAVADASPMQDDFAYYINDGVYGAFNNIMFDHATVRPRVLRGEHGKTFVVTDDDGYRMLESNVSDSSDDIKNQSLFASTVFGPTCDSIDVVARSVLLPKMKIGDWLYFNNMGAYTMAASSSFNGFVPSEIFYVCSVQPEYFEALIAGPDTSGDDEAGREEKKDE